MSDGPPDYEVDWSGDRGSPSFFGCLGMALGLVFLATGGICAFAGIGNQSIGQAIVGLALIAIGWLIMRAGGR